MIIFLDLLLRLTSYITFIFLAIRFTREDSNLAWVNNIHLLHPLSFCCPIGAALKSQTA